MDFLTRKKDKERAGKAQAGHDIREHGRVIAESITLSTVGHNFSKQTVVPVKEKQDKSWISENSDIMASRFQDSDRITVSKTVPTTGSSSFT